MRFSILIPSYKRPRHVEQLIRSLFVYLDKAPFDWEIVVSNNRHPDEKLKDQFKINITDDRLKVFSPEVHLPSAEENFRYGLDHCCGEFVWLLGDDDPLLSYGVSQLVENIHKGDFDFLVMGSRMIKHNGQVTKNTRQPSYQSLHDMPLLDFVRRTGFWYVMAAFSTHIFRREMLDLDLFDQMIKTSKIYSHSTVLIGSFYDKKFRFLNVALVDYRQNIHDAVNTGHWTQAAKNQGVKNKDFWLTGFMKLLQILMDRNVFDHRYLAEVIDLSIADRFRFVDHLIMQLLQQLDLGFNSESERFTTEEFEYVISFLERVTPEYYDYWMMARQIFKGQFNKKDKKLLENFNTLFFKTLSPKKNFLHRFIIGKSGKYTLAYHDNQYVAFDEGQHKYVKELLSYFDYQERKGFILISDTLKGLEDKIIDEQTQATSGFLDGASFSGNGLVVSDSSGSAEDLPMELRVIVFVLRPFKRLMPNSFKKFLLKMVQKSDLEN